MVQVGGGGGGEVFKDSVEWWRWRRWRRWWGNHCYKAERRARDTTYTLQPRDEGEDGAVSNPSNFCSVK